MAKLIFNQQIESTANLVGGGKTDADIAYCGYIPENSALIAHEITDAEYDSLVNGSKSLTIENNSPVLVDSLEDFNSIPNSLWSSSYEQVKSDLERVIKNKPNHSQIPNVQSSLDALNALDENNLTEDPKATLLGQNKYIAINVI